MQSSQELILLKEAMLSAVRRRQIDFSGDGSSSNAEIVKQTSRDVDEMMEIDGKTSVERIEGQKSMNSALFHKTLQTSGQLEDPNGFYEHVCSSLPDVGWSFYVRSVVLCGWQQYALDCLATLPKEAVVGVAQKMVESLQRLDCENGVLLVRHILSHVLSIVTNEAAEWSSDLVEAAIRLECDKILEKQRVEMFVSLLAQLCNVLCGSDRTERVGKVFRLVLEATSDGIDCLDFVHPECGLGECYFALRHVLDERAEEMDCDVVCKMKRWIEKVQMLNLSSSKNEERIQTDVRVVYGTSKFAEECVDRLIDHLAEKPHPGILKCLLDNFLKLEERHVSRLLEIDTSDFTDPCIEIQTICSKAFASWSFAAQDAFRGERHESCSIEDNPPLTQQLLQDLTIVFNRLSCSEIVDDGTISDISLACLRSPMETLHKLMEHAVKNGQPGDVAKILVHMKSTCNAMVRSSKESLLVLLLRLLVVEDDLEPKLWNNLTAVIRELLTVDVLDLVEFVKKALLRHLTPSPYCWRVLNVLKVMLEVSTVDQLRCVFESLSANIVLLLVSQIVDDCMCRYLSVPFENVEWDVLQLKSEAIGALRIANVILRRDEFMRGLDLPWLRQKLDHLHPVIEFHLQDIFYLPRNSKETCFEGMSLHHLLFFGCVSKKNYDEVIAHLIANEVELFPNGFGIGITVVFIKILARLTVAELQTIMELLVTFYNRSSEFSGSLHETLLTVIVNATEACLVLFPSNSAAFTHPHMIRVIQNLTTALKNLIDTVEKLPNEALLQVILHVVRMIRGLCDACQTAPKLLILSLLKDVAVDRSKGSESRDDVQCLAIESIVDNVNDEAFTNRVKQLLNLN